MIKKFISVTALVLVLALGVTGCSGVADLFGGNKEKKEKDAASEDALDNLKPMDECREEILKDIDDLIKVGQYKGVEVTIDAVKVTDQQVEDAINTDLTNGGTVEQIKEGNVASGDVVNIDYEGKVDGVAFDGGTAQGYDLEIGSGAFIPGFEDSLIGVAIGSTTDINVTFPDPYENDPDMSGKKAVFTVTVNYKKGNTIPAQLTDEWVASQNITDVTTVDQYRDYKKSQLEEDAEQQEKEATYNALIKKIIEDSEIKGYSEDLDKEQLKKDQLASMQEYADYYEMELSDLVEQTFAVSMDEYEKGLEEEIDLYCDSLMVYRAVIKAENLKVDQDDYEERVSLFSSDYANYGYENEAEFVKEQSKEIYEGLLNQVAEDYILDNAKVTKK